MAAYTGDDGCGKWIHLGVSLNEKNDDGDKSFSRPLYPNPVCFLCFSHDDHDRAISGKKEEGNVMVVSWLTAINNGGKFIMSLNKRRHTAQLLYGQYQSIRSIQCDAIRGDKVRTELDDDKPPQRENDGLKDPSRTSRTVFFTLCVPVAGMEELVLAVGGRSGRFASKFQNSGNNKDNGSGTEVDTAVDGTPSNEPPVSNRGRRKQRRAMMTRGIPELKRTRYGRGGSTTSSTGDVAGLSTISTNADYHQSIRATNFCIDGTVAHLLCAVDTISSQDDEKDRTSKVNPNTVESSYIYSGEIVDSEHYLISSTVIDAYCREDYWDTTKRIFRPLHQGTKPYLTFFGSQSFGYTTSPT
jgi:hypothetical protein